MIVKDHSILVPDPEPRQATSTRSRKALSAREVKVAMPEDKGGDQIRLEDEEAAPPVSQFRIWKKNLPEWPFLLIGLLSSCAMGAVMPVFSIFFGDILGVLGYQDTQEARDASVKYALYFVLLGVVAGIVMFLMVCTVFC